MPSALGRTSDRARRLSRDRGIASARESLACRPSIPSFAHETEDRLVTTVWFLDFADRAGDVGRKGANRSIETPRRKGGDRGRTRTTEARRVGNPSIRHGQPRSAFYSPHHATERCENVRQASVTGASRAPICVWRRFPRNDSLSFASLLRDTCSDRTRGRPCSWPIARLVSASLTPSSSHRARAPRTYQVGPGRTYGPLGRLLRTCSCPATSGGGGGRSPTAPHLRPGGRHHRKSAPLAQRSPSWAFASRETGPFCQARPTLEIKGGPRRREGLELHRRERFRCFLPPGDDITLRDSVIHDCPETGACSARTTTPDRLE